jgi:hypothetical protein
MIFSNSIRNDLSKAKKYTDTIALVIDRIHIIKNDIRVLPNTFDIIKGNGREVSMTVNTGNNTELRNLIKDNLIQSLSKNNSITNSMIVDII